MSNHLPPRAASDLVRPFIITGGRTRPVDGSLRMETMVQAVAGVNASFTFEHKAIVGACEEPRSIAEIAAEIEVPLGVAVVLVADLVGQGCLEVFESSGVEIELAAISRMIERVRTL
ncbi:MAG TPA: DUF742 domain-containing protein [Acidimicrobiia bacterium]|nr:DUF742 domain-containing protein [Acidimicrobiia bacterium]